ncbi:MAG: MBL fold metallo-hydrolase [Acetatifactor sp.]|nr:MBL fold metallo-hydrolase [Acetatifactor sp.]
MKDINVTPEGSIYGTYLTDFGAWGIQTRNVTCFLLVGSKRALLIDTAYGEGDLRALVESITDLPLTVVNTHGHYDHTSGNAFFEEVWMGEGAAEIALGVETRTKLPHPDYTIRTLKDGQEFDLGDRVVEAIAIGAHHASSFAFLDKENRTIYTGDELEAAQVLLNVRRDDLATKEIVKLHLANMRKLKERSHEFDRLVPAHNGGPLAKSYIDDYIDLSKAILEGSIKPLETVAGFGWPSTIFGGDEKLVRYHLGKATFVCNRDQAVI